MEQGDWLNILEGVPLGFNFFIFIFPEFVEIGVTAAAVAAAAAAGAAGAIIRDDDVEEIAFQSHGLYFRFWSEIRFFHFLVIL